MVEPHLELNCRTKSRLEIIAAMFLVTNLNRIISGKAKPRRILSMSSDGRRQNPMSFVDDGLRKFPIWIFGAVLFGLKGVILI